MLPVLCSNTQRGGKSEQSASSEQAIPFFPVSLLLSEEQQRRCPKKITKAELRSLERVYARFLADQRNNLFIGSLRIRKLARILFRKRQ